MNEYYDILSYAWKAPLTHGSLQQHSTPFTIPHAFFLVLYLPLTLPLSHQYVTLSGLFHRNQTGIQWSIAPSLQFFVIKYWSRCYCCFVLSPPVCLLPLPLHILFQFPLEMALLENRSHTSLFCYFDAIQSN